MLGAGLVTMAACGGSPAPTSADPGASSAGGAAAHTTGPARGVAASPAPSGPLSACVLNVDALARDTGIAWHAVDDRPGSTSTIGGCAYQPDNQSGARIAYTWSDFTGSGVAPATFLMSSGLQSLGCVNGTLRTVPAGDSAFVCLTSGESDVGGMIAKGQLVASLVASGTNAAGLTRDQIESAISAQLRLEPFPKS